MTIGPIRMPCVSRASAASSVHASRQSVFTESWFRKRWSDTQRRVKPAVFAARAMSRTVS